MNYESINMGSYNLHIIKTGYLKLSYGADYKVKNTFEWIYITIDKDSNRIINWSSVGFDSPVFYYSQFKFYTDILDLKNNSYLGIDRNGKFEPELMFFLKDDYSSIVYFSDVKIPLSILDTFKIYSYDFLGKKVSRFTKYSDLFIDSSNKSRLENLIANTIGEAISLDSNQFFEVINKSS